MTGEVGSEVSLGSDSGCGGLSLRVGWDRRPSRAAAPSREDYNSRRAPLRDHWTGSRCLFILRVSIWLPALGPHSFWFGGALCCPPSRSSACHCSPPCSLARFLPRKLLLQHPQEKNRGLGQSGLEVVGWDLNTG